MYVGNLCARKNQKQLIESFVLMPTDLCEKTYICFLGGTQESDDIKESINRSPYKNHFKICGTIDKELVPQYYEQGDAVVLISQSEGFGLSLIEGMHFGLPCMTFTDVDAYEDIYSPDAVIGVEDHTNKAVAEGLQTLLTKEWNKNAIKAHSKKFESEEMAKRYIDFYMKYK